MKHTFFTYLSLIGLLFADTACGFSPLFNHLSPNRDKTPEINSIFADVDDCHFYLKTENLCATLSWTQEPGINASGDEVDGSFILKLWDRNLATALAGPFNDPKSGVPFVKLWMTSMGHGSSKVTLVPVKDDAGQTLSGQYSAANVHFVMGGQWDIKLQIRATAGGAVLDESVIPYTVNH